MMTSATFAIIADQTPQALELQQQLFAHFPACAPQEEAQIIIALGGDGFMLETLRRHRGSARAIYGINCGTVGFLMNTLPCHTKDMTAVDSTMLQRTLTHLPARILEADRVSLTPLNVTVTTQDQQTHHGFAINEVSLLRERHQAAKIKISIDGTVRLDELVGDGVLVATPAGSTAYNLSVRGPVLPLRAQLLALTPISPFRPRRWHGALLPNTSVVDFTILEGSKRPVSAVMDDQEIRNVLSVRAVEDPSNTVTVLFDPDQRLDERILREQFAL